MSELDELAQAGQSVQATSTRKATSRSQARRRPVGRAPVQAPKSAAALYVLFGVLLALGGVAGAYLIYKHVANEPEKLAAEKALADAGHTEQQKAELLAGLKKSVRVTPHIVSDTLLNVMAMNTSKTTTTTLAVEVVSGDPERVVARLEFGVLQPNQTKSGDAYIKGIREMVKAGQDPRLQLAVGDASVAKAGQVIQVGEGLNEPRRADTDTVPDDGAVFSAQGKTRGQRIDEDPTLTRLCTSFPELRPPLENRNLEDLSKVVTRLSQDEKITPEDAARINAFGASQ